MAARKQNKMLVSKTCRQSSDSQIPKIPKIPKFDIEAVPSAVKKSPLKLKEWLDAHIPALIGPRIRFYGPSVRTTGRDPDHPWGILFHN
jgi:hypothetical protein